MTEQTSKSLDFSNLGIAPKLLDIIGQLRFTTPTTIQRKSIPIAIEGKDLVGIAQTGTGKTMAFGIPMIQRLASHGGKGLVLVPTRELALQVNESLKNIGGKLGLRTAVLIGGAPKEPQLKALAARPHLIIATPGRLIDYLQGRVLHLRDVKILVLDEADLMFDMGFIPQITEILKSVPAERQTLLFSATMPSAIMQIIARHMKLPVSIEVAPSGTPVENVTQEVVVINREDKFEQMKKTLAQYRGSVLVFARTKHGVKNLARKLKTQGFSVAEIHSGRSQNQRSSALKGFKIGQHRILIATDIAARGIDVQNIELVLNFDLPETSEDYVHRIGRTARAGKNGQAITFASPSEILAVRKIEQLIKKTLPKTHLATAESEAPERYPRRSAQGPQPARFNRQRRSPYRQHSDGPRNSFSRRKKKFQPSNKKYY